MAKSNKPIVWGLFAAGGTVTAFVTPVLIVVTLLAALGNAPPALGYEELHAVAAHWAGKVALFGIITLSLWHAAHRLRITLHDAGLRNDASAAWVLYMGSAVGTIATALFVLRI
ncbi:MAG: fumarate reductase subunit FrdD [Betaproteobacteria bacterium]